MYAFVDKWQVIGWIRLETVYDVILNVSLVMVIMGAVVFIVSFAGCVGALRENTCLLKFVRFFSVFFHKFFNVVCFLVLCLFADVFPDRNGHCHHDFRLPPLHPDAARE